MYFRVGGRVGCAREPLSGGDRGGRGSGLEHKLEVPRNTRCHPLSRGYQEIKLCRSIWLSVKLLSGANSVL